MQGECGNTNKYCYEYYQVSSEYISHIFLVFLFKLSFLVLGVRFQLVIFSYLFYKIIIIININSLLF